MKTISYMKRRNLGNYEHAEVAVTDVVEDGQSPLAVLNSLKAFVEEALYGAPTKEIQIELNLVTDKADAIPAKAEVAEVKAPKSKPETTRIKVKDAKKVETSVNENPTQGEVPPTEVKPLDKPEVVAALTEVVEEKKTKTKVTVKTKATVYDRTLDTHKAVLALFLDKDAPRWRTPDEIKKASKASRDLNGKDFLDANGDILESFKTEFIRIMAEA